MKPGKLTKEEFEEMKKHTIYGCKILEKFKQDENEFYRYCYDICRYHHERYDGNGYPEGIAGEDIPIWAQVVSIVDVYDALVSKRVYKPAYSVDKAVHMIESGECGVFSPKIMDCFLRARAHLQIKSKG
jgi:putative two-component system response regulator